MPEIPPISTLMTVSDLPSSACAIASFSASLNTCPPSYDRRYSRRYRGDRAVCCVERTRPEIRMILGMTEIPPILRRVHRLLRADDARAAGQFPPFQTVVQKRVLFLELISEVANQKRQTAVRQNVQIPAVRHKQQRGGFGVHVVRQMLAPHQQIPGFVLGNSQSPRQFLPEC